MRLAVFDGGRLGVVEQDQICEVGAGRPDPKGPLQVLLERGERPGDFTGIRLPLASATLEPPLPRPGKIIGAPVNYVDHQREMNEPTTVAELGVFLKASSSVLGPGGTIRLPYTDKRTDQEAELAVVIGRGGRHIGVHDALDHVAGYMCGLDIVVRSTEDRSTRKSFDTFCPLGPWLTTADEVGDPGSLRLRGWVNGELRQDASTEDMIFGVPELIAYASSVFTLWPGDVIVTGTPAGVGPLTDGDVVVVDIERVGRLEVSVSAEGAVPYAERPGRRAGAGAGKRA